VVMLDCQSKGSGFKSQPRQKFGSRFPLHLHPLANSAMMSTLIIHCQWEDEMMRERTGHPPSYAKANKMKSLALHAHDCLRAGLRDCSSSSFSAELMLSKVILILVFCLRYVIDVKVDNVLLNRVLIMMSVDLFAKALYFPE